MYKLTFKEICQTELEIKNSTITAAQHLFYFLLSRGKSIIGDVTSQFQSIK